PLFDGVEAFLGELRRAGIPAAIVTSRGDRKMERLFGMHPGVRELFDGVVTDSWVSRGKPDPECYLVAARELGVKPSDCYVFEDSFNGLKAGRAAGAKVIALTTSNPRESMEALADRVIDRLEDFSIAILDTI
ncbi:MAG: HAD family hydrolase, partial [Muribaculaceae bacterium]|nr:HAD family hydrolase [Muribaculaceae bacterium]